MDKRWLFVGAPVLIFLLLFAAVVFVLPFFLNADSFRPAIESQLSGALGRTVSMGKLSFSLVHGTLMADDVAVSDDPSFSSVPFLQAKRLEVGIEIFPLLSHREVHITALTLDTPSIQLIEHANGRWNYSSLGSNASPPQSAPSVPGFNIEQLKIVKGSALVSSIPQTARPFEYSEIGLTLRQFSFQKSFPFELSAKLPANGTLTLTGEAGPMSSADASQTPFHAKLQIREFDPLAAGMIEQDKGIAMVDDVDADIASDTVTLTSTGKIKASRLQLAPKGSPTMEPVDIDYSYSRNLATHEGILSDVAIHTGSAAIHVKGTIKSPPEGLTLDLHLSAPAIPIEQVERLLPVVGIRLPTGSSLQGGTLTAEMKITGPPTAATLDGSIEIDNTSLMRFDLGSRIEAPNPIGSTGDAIAIRVLKANVNSSPQSTRLSNINGDLPKLGTATGDGSVAPSGELDLRLNAKLYAATPAGAPAIVESSLRANARPAQVPSRSATITITGTAASPTISVRAGASAR